MAAAPKRGPGRPTEREGESKRAPISMRTTQTIRAALEDAADRGGRSLAQEIEQRLERSLRQDEAHSPDTSDALDSIQRMMEKVHDLVGDWTRDLTAWEIVADGVAELLSRYRPENRRDIPPPLDLADDQAAQLAQYERNLAEWNGLRVAAGRKRLSATMKAQSGDDLLGHDGESVVASCAAIDAIPPKPESPLKPDQLERYEARRAHESGLTAARNLVSALSVPRTSRSHNR